MRRSVQRQPAIDREALDQRAYFDWLAIFHPVAWEHTFHPPNGGHRNPVVAAKLKAQGVKAGVFDIVMELARGAYHGLRIELKATPPYNAAVSPTQRAWGARLNGAGYCALVCLGVDAARAATEAYLRLGPYDGKSIHPTISK